jgi:prepilin-type N-terminal cleavage/methylation domain-containing protein
VKLLRRLRRVGREEAGFSLLELLTVTAILSTVLVGITTAFVSGSNAELHANRRVQAQIQAGLAFDRLRRDIHCASSATVTTTTTQSMTLSGCGSGSVTWCTVASGSQWKLYRASGSTCDATGRLYAASLTSASVFTYTSSVSGTSLAYVSVSIPVNVDPSTSVDSYTLGDNIVLRNSSRS